MAYKNPRRKPVWQVPRCTKNQRRKTAENSKREETGKAGKEKRLKKKAAMMPSPFWET